MLMGDVPADSSWACEEFDGAVKYSSTHGSVVIEKDPWKRFQTAKELDASLQAVTFRSTQEHVAPTEEPSGPSGTVLALVAVAALIVGLVLGVALG